MNKWLFFLIKSRVLKMLFFLAFLQTIWAESVLNFLFRHAEVMKKIIETVAEGGGELGVHMYPFMPRSCYMSAFLSYAAIVLDC